MDEDHVKDSHVPQSVLQPELVVAEARGACIGDDGGGDQCKDRASKYPEVDDVKQGLRFGDDHVAAKDDGPAANGNGEVVDGIGTERGDTHKAPVVGHFRADHGKGQDPSQGAVGAAAAAQTIAEAVDQIDQGGGQKNGQNVGEGECNKFDLVALSEKVAQKLFHGGLLSMM